jgi:Sulfotransferase family
MAEQPGRVPTLDELMTLAERDTGLSDFGPPTFRAGFDRFLQSLAEDARLPEQALTPVLDTLRRRLRNRLEIEDWYRTHPGIGDTPVEGPVSITGIPRSGTTALADMLSLDPGFRPLRGWEQANPCPPPVLAEEADDPRRVEALRSQRVMQEQSPDQMAMHLWEVDATTEDTDVLGLEGRAQSAIVPVTGYHVWWRDGTMVDAYRYHRRVAELLHSRRPPNRWLFKAPHMSFHLEDFVAAYPGARFVMCHRDPLKAVPSWISFVTSLFPPGALDVTDLSTYGPHLGAHIAVGAVRSIEGRLRLGEDRFLDVHHHELSANPIRTIQRIYGWLGQQLDPDVRDKMAVWAERNRAGAHGTHRYTLDQFGLDAATLRADFSRYTDHFDVKLEA